MYVYVYMYTYHDVQILSCEVFYEYSLSKSLQPNDTSMLKMRKDSHAEK